jgi:hypothetical protein
MSLTQSEQEWFTKQFGDVHKKVDGQHTDIIQRLTAVETVVGERRQPCAGLVAVRKDVDQLEDARENQSRLIFKYFLAILSGVAIGGGVIEAVNRLLQ